MGLETAAGKALTSKADQYQLVKKIGKGSFGWFWLAKRKSDGIDVVVKKTLFESDEAMAGAKAEAEMLQRMMHPNIIQFYDSFEQNSKFYIVTEFAAGTPQDLGALVAKKGPLAEGRVKEILALLCSALTHVHQKKIVHGDVKPQNILLMADGSIKLGDFGIGRGMESTKSPLMTSRGRATPAFAPPELVMDSVFGTATDIWAMGVTAYYLLSGSLPFQTVRESLEQGPPALPPEVSSGLGQLVFDMMSKDPTERPTASGLHGHPLLKTLGVVCWRDPQVRNHYNDAKLRAMQARYAGKISLIGAETDDDALNVIELSEKRRLWVITNRGNGCVAFVDKVRAAGVRSQMLMFCLNTAVLRPMERVTVDVADDAVPRFLDGTVIPELARLGG